MYLNKHVPRKIVKETLLYNSIFYRELTSAYHDMGYNSTFFESTYRHYELAPFIVEDEDNRINTQYRLHVAMKGMDNSLLLLLSIGEVNTNGTAHFVHCCNEDECINSSHDLGSNLYIRNTFSFNSIASKARQNAGVAEERMGKKPDIMGIMKQKEKILELVYVESLRIICTNSKKEDDADLGGIPRYFHLDYAEIPLSPHISHTKSLIRLLLTLRNTIIVNRNLVMQALEQASSHPPQNVNPSPTVSTPPYNK
ncbi:hypothetical protein C1646_763521 [Rhizophagus diaphanus]|nr:hypothetical protein C1646_763521 [Rhizophagus diaphanus] [Rhizophagus sp. MUCL 43196]